MFKTYLYIVFCQKLKIGKITFYHILVIISLVHAARYAWFWSDGSQIVRGGFYPGSLSGGLLSGKFCLGWFLSVPVLSEYICYHRKLNITFNFVFRMYDKKFISVTSRAFYPLPLSQTVTPSRTPSAPRA